MNNLRTHFLSLTCLFHVILDNMDGIDIAMTLITTILFSVIASPVILLLHAGLYYFLRNSELFNGLLVSAIIVLSFKYLTYFGLFWGGQVPSKRILVTFLVLEIPFTIAYWILSSGIIWKLALKIKDS